MAGENQDKGRDFASLWFKKSEPVSFPGVGHASTIRAGDLGVKRIFRRDGDAHVLVTLESGREFEVSMAIVGVLERSVKS